MSFLGLNGKQKTFTLHCYMQQNIGMSTYCCSETFHTTTNSHFFINVQLRLEMRTNSFTVGHNHEGACATCAQNCSLRKKARDTEYRCLNRFISDVRERRISS